MDCSLYCSPLMYPLHFGYASHYVAPPEAVEPSLDWHLTDLREVKVIVV
uniref:Uncharacterized protein n=1 Tax=Ascaris lumbricoides TaxID=6252 RepID=A0A0M3HF90_ASCLU